MINIIKKRIITDDLVVTLAYIMCIFGLHLFVYLHTSFIYVSFHERYEKAILLLSYFRTNYLTPDQ